MTTMDRTIDPIADRTIDRTIDPTADRAIGPAADPTTGAAPGAPVPPRHAPVRIAPDTFVVQATQGEGMGPVAVHLNAMVIRGPEPMIVDTGAPALRDRYLEDMWSLVDPTDVRWVFLSHDDVDHYGNLEAIMEACPQATLLTSWFQWERLGNLPTIAPHRMRWLETDRPFEANGRTFVTVRPPLYDSPTTRGLLDTATGVYWASDCFATLVPHGMADVAELPRDAWVEGCILNAQQLSPWVAMADRQAYARTVERFAGLGIRTIASCHSPTITGGYVAEAVDLLRTLPDAASRPVPGQDLLDQLVAMASGVPA